MTLRRISCSTCGSSQFEHDDEGNLICAHCGNKFASPREKVACPTCGVQNPPEAKRCMNCGSSLGLSCPICGHRNPPGADHCLECATPLDAFSAIVARQNSDGAMRRRLVEAKAADAAYMRAEREKIDAEERERLRQLAAQSQEAQRQQRALITITLVFGLIGLGLIVMAVVFFSN